MVKRAMVDEKSGVLVGVERTHGLKHRPMERSLEAFQKQQEHEFELLQEAKKRVANRKVDIEHKLTEVNLKIKANEAIMKEEYSYIDKVRKRQWTDNERFMAYVKKNLDNYFKAEAKLEKLQAQREKLKYELVKLQLKKLS